MRGADAFRFSSPSSSSRTSRARFGLAWGAWVVFPPAGFPSMLDEECILDVQEKGSTLHNEGNVYLPSSESLIPPVSLCACRLADHEGGEVCQCPPRTAHTSPAGANFPISHFRTPARKSSSVNEDPPDEDGSDLSGRPLRYVSGCSPERLLVTSLEARAGGSNHSRLEPKWLRCSLSLSLSLPLHPF